MRVEKCFQQKPIINESDDDTHIFISLDFDYGLIFGVPDRAIDAEVHADDSQVPEASKHADDSTISHMMLLI